MDDTAARFTLDPSLVVRKGIARPARSQVLAGEGPRRRELDIDEPLLIAALFRLQLPLTKPEIASLLSLELGALQTEAGRLLETLIDAAALVPEGQAQASQARWDRWGWRDALELHRSTREASGAPPDFPAQPPRPTRGDRKRFVLPEPTGRLDRVPFRTALEDRRTHRDFAPRPVEAETLSELFRAAFAPDMTLFAAYPLLLKVEGLPPGVYRYAPEAHAIDELRSGDFAAELVELSQGQAFLRGAAAAVFLCACWRGHMQRTGGSQGYRMALIELAGIVQDLLLAAAGLGLKSFMTAVVSETAAARMLEIEDPLLESPLYLVGLGHSSGEPGAFTTAVAKG